MTVTTAQRSEAAQATVCTCATDTLMLVPEAAKLLRCSREFVYARLRQGRFPGTQIGRSWKMPSAFVHGYIRDVLSVGRSVTLDDYATAWRAKHSAEATA